MLNNKNRDILLVEVYVVTAFLEDNAAGFIRKLEHTILLLKDLA